MTTSDIIVLIYGYSFSGILIYLIDHGMDKRYQLIAWVIAIIITLCYSLFSVKGQFTAMNYGLLTLPIVAPLAFNFAAIISWRISGRELRATWRGARYFYTGKKNLSDYLLSFFVIMIELGWPILTAVLWKEF